MTDTGSALRKYAEAGKPLVEQWIDLSEEFKALRDAARNDGVDWAAIKGLLKAQLLDARDGGSKRVDALLEKADLATAYADMLGIKVSEKNFSRDHDGIPPFLDRREATA